MESSYDPNRQADDFTYLRRLGYRSSYRLQDNVSSDTRYYRPAGCGI
jgi:hypothetical protein